MDIETQNQLLETTYQMLLAFFDTEIKIEEGSSQESEELQDFFSKSNIFPNENEIQPKEKQNEDGQKSFNSNELQKSEYSAEQKIINHFKVLIEHKFYSLSDCKTQSLIKYIKRNGTAYLAEFFYLFLRLLTNQHKDKIIRAALILRDFICNNQSLNDLFNSLILINHDNDISNDIIENIIVVLQILHSFQCLSFNDLNIAISHLLNSKKIGFNFQNETLNYIENDTFPIPQHNDIKKEHKIQLLQKENNELKNNIILLKEEISSLQKNCLTKDQIQNQNHSKSFNNEIFDEMIKVSKMIPNKRTYSEKYYAIMTSAFLVGEPCYNILQKYLPIPHESKIREKMYPIIRKYINNLLNINNCDNIIDSLHMIQPNNDPLYATLAIDAAKFKNISGKDIKKNFSKISEIANDNTFLNNIIDEKIYKNIFVFHIQPVNKNIKPFPIYVHFSDSGAANDDIKEAFEFLRKRLLKYNIIIKFCATDGDHFYDHFHDLFFQKILKMIKQKKSFSQIISFISKDFLKNDIVIPISDFLHSIKLLRSYFLEEKIHLDIRSNISIKPSEMSKYNLGYVLSDISSIGRMKDSYPLELFSNDTLLKSIDFKDFHILFFILPFNLLIESLKNPNLSISFRIFLLEISYQFLLFHLFQKDFKKNSIHSRIGIERLINTTIGLGVALQVFDFIKLGQISSHPLENLFGMIRLSCKNNHTWKNILYSLGRAFYFKRLIDDNSIVIKRRERVSIAGVSVSDEQNDGDISSYSPFQLFLMVWANMKENNSDVKTQNISPFIFWFKNFKKIQWNEKLYRPSKLSGSAISSRYKNDDENDAIIISKKRKKQAKKPKNKQKIEIKTRNNLDEFEKKALNCNNIYDFINLLYDNSIKDYSIKLSEHIAKYERKKKDKKHE